MSNETEHHASEPSDATVAMFLLENDADELTDILVAALSDAFRILDKDIAFDRLH